MSGNTWDPGKAGSHVTINPDGVTVSIAGDQDCVAALIGRLASDGGKWVYECSCAVFPGNASPMFGVALSTQDWNETLGFGAFGWSFWATNTYTKFHSGNQGAYGDDLTAKGETTYCMTCLDLDAGNLSFRWTRVSTPGVSTDLGIAFGGLAGTIYPAFGTGNTGSEASGTVLNCAGPFYNATPVGYLPFTSSLTPSAFFAVL